MLEWLDRRQARSRVLGTVWAVLRKYADERGSRLAAVIAFYAFFSLFPLMLVLVTVLGFLLQNDSGLRERVLNSVIGDFPVVGDQISRNVGTLQGSGPALVIGLVAAVWSGLAVVDAASTALDNIHDIPRSAQATFVRRRLRGLVFLVGFGSVLLVVSAATSLLASFAGLPVVGRVLLFVPTAALHIGLLLVAYLLLPSRRLPVRSLLPGAIVGGAGFFLLAELGGFYLRHVVRNASDTYGIFAVVIGLLTWMLLQAHVTLLGAELNTVLERRLLPRRLARSLPEREGDRRAMATIGGQPATQMGG